ncbi:flagellar hook assembly protein FlgD [Desulfurivibrio dismutans]|uniref:flagellar hook assembly protein FlgD n=1 Tax=Desulfurivibrio dismutans TaxID=1398908 RepID=UPI0023DB8DC9|nr:flagellar hook assembly protein FlgD [Desulfurivibrio alkaliphilus]MDF1614670.1 flagellar hook assembly protein FlgD [Desulfurivibrio alkaliphilus]
MTMISAGYGPDIPMADQGSHLKPVGSSSLDRQDFMTLFITQLQHQDPMKPMESYEMASQLAHFSSMEATMKMSDNMEKMLNYTTSQNNLQLLSLIGKTIETQGNEIGVTDGQVARTSYVLEQDAPFSVVYIHNAAGQLVRTIDNGFQSAGQNTLAWDGKDNSGQEVPDGMYIYKVDALAGDGSKVAVEQRASGKVTGLEFDSGRAAITVSGYIQKYVSDIINVHENSSGLPGQDSDTGQDSGDEEEDILMGLMG